MISVSVNRIGYPSLTFTMHKVYFETSCQSVRELFSKKTTSRSTRFPNQFNIIRPGLNLMLEETLYSTEAL